MIIQVDKQGQDIIEQLCDIALKQGGIKNLQAIHQVLASVKLIEENKIEDKEIKK